MDRWGDAAAIDQSLWLIVFGVIAMMLLIYPDGSPPADARWGGVARGIAIVFPLAFGWGLFGAHQQLDPPVHAFRNPLAVRALESPLTKVVNVVLLVGCFGLILASAASVAVRYRNGESAQRYQLKWMLLAAGTLPATGLICLAVGIFNPSVGESAGSYGFNVVLLAVPVEMAFAMTRYRLYSLYRFVDSALVHLTLTALLVGAYAAIVLGSSRLADNGGRRSPVVVAVA
ncbi:MAG: hypothetical protein ACR2JQ_00490, partial [Mycobacteriales bacterium]